MCREFLIVTFFLTQKFKENLALSSLCRREKERERLGWERKRLDSCPFQCPVCALRLHLLRLLLLLLLPTTQTNQMPNDFALVKYYNKGFLIWCSLRRDSFHFVFMNNLFYISLMTWVEVASRYFFGLWICTSFLFLPKSNLSFHLHHSNQSLTFVSSV